MDHLTVTKIWKTYAFFSSRSYSVSVWLQPSLTSWQALTAFTEPPMSIQKKLSSISRKFKFILTLSLCLGESREPKWWCHISWFRVGWLKLLIDGISLMPSEQISNYKNPFNDWQKCLTASVTLTASAQGQVLNEDGIVPAVIFHYNKDAGDTWRSSYREDVITTAWAVPIL